MSKIIESIFPFSENWSWLTFCLYVIVGMIVTSFCKRGAKATAYNKKKGQKVKNSEIYYFLAFIVLVLLATLRTENVGSDTRVYVDYFKQATYYKELYSSYKIMEQGFLIYNSLIRKITSNYTIYFFITYSFIAWSYINYIKNHFDDNSDYIFLQLFIFFYTSNMSGVRSGIGVAFLLFSYTKLSKGKTIQAIILTIIAISFHYTTAINIYMICMIGIFKNQNRLKRKWIWIVTTIGTIVVSYIGVFKIKSIFIGTKYEFYSSISVEELSLLGSTFFIIFIVLCIVNYKALFYKTKGKMSLRNSLIFSMSLAVLYPIIYIAGAYRIPNYYALPRLNVWSEINNILIYKFGVENKHRMLFKVILQIIVILYLLFKFTRSATDGYFRYEFII